MADPNDATGIHLIGYSCAGCPIGHRGTFFMTGVAVAAGVAALARGRVGRSSRIEAPVLTYSRAARCKDNSKQVI